MNSSLRSRLALMKTPLVTLGAILLSTAPALAINGGGSGTLSAIETGATQVQSAMIFVGFTGTISGIAVGAWHFFRHQDDWLGGATRVLAGMAGGVIVSQAVPLASIAGGLKI